MKSLFGTGLRRWILVTGLACIAAGGGYVTLRRVAWPRYKDWRAQRINRVAREYLAKGDYENALLAVRNNLRDNQRYLDTWELAAEIAKAKNSPDAILYLDHIAKSRGTLAPKLEEIRLALRFGYLRYALDTVAGVGPAGRDSADFHRLAAETYQRVGRPIDAKYQLISLIGLSPDDGKAQLDLAAIELEEAHFQGDAALRARLEGLARQPALRIRATSLLLEDAIARRSHGDSEDLAERLAALTPLGPRRPRARPAAAWRSATPSGPPPTAMSSNGRLPRIPRGSWRSSGIFSRLATTTGPTAGTRTCPRSPAGTPASSGRWPT